jgi:hypothetical protein
LSPGSSPTPGGSTGSVNPFQTIERKDVGLTLRSSRRSAKTAPSSCTIFQEVSSVQASTVNSANGPTTNKRSIESNVLVDDGSIVVLGGLLQDEYSGNQEKVPGAGRRAPVWQPVQERGPQPQKTNLMVFLRPVVVRDAAASDALSMDRYDLMRAAAAAAGAQPEPSACGAGQRGAGAARAAAMRARPPKVSHRPAMSHALPPALRLCPQRTSCCWRTTQQLTLWLHGPGAPDAAAPGRGAAQVCRAPVQLKAAEALASASARPTPRASPAPPPWSAR